MFEAGPEGFAGGLSAANYMRITGAPTATTTRDLAALVAMDALICSGVQKSTRYRLNASVARGFGRGRGHPLMVVELGEDPGRSLRGGHYYAASCKNIRAKVVLVRNILANSTPDLKPIGAR